MHVVVMETILDDSREK